MESVGQKLRDARLRKKVALEVISAATKINLRNLTAIEADELAEISSRFTYRSFVRQFAQHVGVDWVQLEPLVNDISGQIPEARVPGQAGGFVPPSIPGLKPKRTQKLRWALSISSLAVTLTLCSTFYGQWETARNDFRGSLAAITSVFTLHNNRNVVRREPKQTPPQVQVSKSVPPVPPAAPETDQSAPVKTDGFRIELSALEQCWLSVVTDGKEVFAGILQPAQTKVLDGRDEARVRTGNAGGIEVNFNGRALGTLGRRGEVRTVVFNKNGYEVLEHSARVELELLAGPATRDGE
jgi:hypothetical protein